MKSSDLSVSEVDGELKGPHVGAKNRRHPHARAAVRSIDRPPATDGRVDSDANATAPIAPMRTIGPTSSPQFSHGSVLVQRNSPEAMAAPAPTKAPFNRESGWRTSTRLMSFVVNRRETPSALVVTASPDTPTMRALCSWPLESRDPDCHSRRRQVAEVRPDGPSRLGRGGRRREQEEHGERRPGVVQAHEVPPAGNAPGPFRSPVLAKLTR